MATIDLTNINRFKNKDINFVQKILHENEYEEYNLAENKAKFLATRWAIKEALYKINNKYSSFSKIHIQKKKGQYTFKYYNISTTSEDNYIIAVVERKNTCLF